MYLQVFLYIFCDERAKRVFLNVQATMIRFKHKFPIILFVSTLDLSTILSMQGALN